MSYFDDKPSERRVIPEHIRRNIPADFLEFLDNRKPSSHYFPKFAKWLQGRIIAEEFGVGRVDSKALSSFKMNEALKTVTNDEGYTVRRDGVHTVVITPSGKTLRARTRAAFSEEELCYRLTFEFIDIPFWTGTAEQLSLEELTKLAAVIKDAHHAFGYVTAFKLPLDFHEDYTDS